MKTGQLQLGASRLGKDGTIGTRMTRMERIEPTPATDVYMRDEDPFCQALTLGVPRVPFPSRRPQKSLARGEKPSFAPLELSVSGQSVTDVVRAHAFEIHVTARNHPLKSTKTLI